MKTMATTPLSAPSSSYAKARSVARSAATAGASPLVSPNSPLVSWTKWPFLTSLLVAAGCLALPLANPVQSLAVQDRAAHDVQLAGSASSARGELSGERSVEARRSASAGMGSTNHRQNQAL